MDHETHGGRRFSVAASRARRSATVVGAMLAALSPEEIPGEGRGARGLPSFVVCARNPEVPPSSWSREFTDGEGLEESPFEVAVGDALRALGYEIARQVGVAGFRIDLAVWNEHRTGSCSASNVIVRPVIPFLPPGTATGSGRPNLNVLGGASSAFGQRPSGETPLNN